MIAAHPSHVHQPIALPCPGPRIFTPRSPNFKASSGVEPYARANEQDPGFAFKASGQCPEDRR